MKDRFFFIVILILLGIYLLNHFGDASQFEAAIKSSSVYKTYQQHTNGTSETAKLERESQTEYNLSQSSSKPTKILGGLRLANFQEAIPKPTWYDRVEAPIANTAKDVSKVWQSKKRCCESKEVLKANNQEFYKSCYRAIENYFTDEKLVVKCLWLMDAGMSREHSLKIKRFLVTHFSHHKNDISGCVNCAPADTVARVTFELASIIRRRGNPDESIALVERVLDSRLDEISPWVQIEIYSELSKWYAEDDDKRRNRLRYALQSLDAISQSGNKSAKRRLPNFEKNAEKFLNNPNSIK